MSPRKNSGFTLWELMLVIAFVIVLFLAGINSLLPLRGAAEEVAHLSTVAALRSAVGFEMTNRVIGEGMRGLAKMESANPVDWLQAPMVNYHGRITSEDYDRIPRRHWAFDAGTNVLVYRVGYPEYFIGSYTDPAAIRYKVIVEHGEGGTIRNVQLQQIDAGEWTVDGSELARWTGGENEQRID